MHVNKAAVVGAGTMGGEIAYSIANAEIPVVLKDVDQKFVEIGLAKARSVWQAQVDKDKLSADELERKFALIQGTTSYDDFGDVDFVIEAVPELMPIKQAVFAELDASTPAHAVLASNTSSLSIDEIAEATVRAEQVVGFHYFYPASRAKLVEVIEGSETSPETVIDAINFAQRIKKGPITCGDSPGFVVNRVLSAGMAEMYKFQQEHNLSAAEIDDAAIEAQILPTGPCRLADMLGLDTVLHVQEYLFAELGETFFVSEQMKELVADGNLGLKTGKGFYDYGAAK